jgi:hypothetical protein
MDKIDPSHFDKWLCEVEVPRRILEIMDKSPLGGISGTAAITIRLNQKIMFTMTTPIKFVKEL